MLTFMLTCVTCTSHVTSLGWGGVGMFTFMLTCVTCTSHVTSLGWGVGMLTFMLTCVTCTSHGTSLGWGGGDVNVHVSLRQMHISRYVTWVGGVGMLTFMLTCDYLSLPYHAVPRPDPTAMLTQGWCEASGCGSGVGWTPRPKVWWRSQVKPWRIVWQREWKKSREFSGTNSL